MVVTVATGRCAAATFARMARTAAASSVGSLRRRVTSASGTPDTGVPITGITPLTWEITR